MALCGCGGALTHVVPARHRDPFQQNEPRLVGRIAGQQIVGIVHLARPALEITPDEVQRRKPV